jgi:SAM-dependent methyltransferase
MPTPQTDGPEPLRAMLREAERRLRLNREELQAISHDLEQTLVRAVGGHEAATRAAVRAGGESFRKVVEYRHLLRRFRAAARAALPKGATALVASKGDDELLNLRGRRAWHFPRAGDGSYAGYHPADDRAAIEHLEDLRREGAGFFLLPATGFWWLDHYRDFARHLESYYRCVARRECCVVYDLSGEGADGYGLRELQRNWDEFGRRDPLWAILTVPEKINRKWKARDFFATGEREVREVMCYVEALGVPFARRRALDFGCGVGRLTQALCLYFKESCGVDIAPSMIELAARYNRHGERCRYFVNPAGDLRLFESDSFDFVYSNIVLQHMGPEHSKNYIREFLRVLAPGGVLVFQLPSEPNPAHLPVAPEALTGALPDAAFKAAIKVRKAPASARAATQATVRVAVKNLSRFKWPAAGTAAGRYRIWLGCSWLGEGGDVLVFDDGRAVLPRELRPREEVELALRVNVPGRPGAYVLELDLVQEGVAWFKQKGSETARVRVRVRENPGLVSEGAGPLAQPKMEMYGVPKDEVLGVLAEGGGEVLDVREDFHAAPEWLGFRYCVRKAAG